MLADEGGRPIDHAVVTANIDMAAMSMDSTFHAMSGGPHGTYTETLRLTMPGHWRIELKVKRAGFPTETLDVPVFVDLP
jgi:hypothetical protein